MRHLGRGELSVNSEQPCETAELKELVDYNKQVLKSTILMY
jgi:hypothetical protein